VLCKLAHGANFFKCNELFVMGKLIILFILCEFIYVVNHVYKNVIMCRPQRGGIDLILLRKSPMKINFCVFYETHETKGYFFVCNEIKEY
jgi:hypothetical protein